MNKEDKIIELLETILAELRLKPNYIPQPYPIYIQPNPLQPYVNPYSSYPNPAAPPLYTVTC